MLALNGGDNKMAAVGIKRLYFVVLKVESYSQNLLYSSVWL